MRAPHPWCGHEKLQKEGRLDFLGPIFFLIAWMGMLGTIAASQMQLRSGLTAVRRSKISTRVRRGLPLPFVAGFASAGPGALYRFPQPSGVQVGDVVVLFVHDRGSSGAVSDMDFGTPVGWVKIGRAGEQRGALCAYKRIWQTGDQMPMINEMPGSVSTGSANGPSIQTQSASYAIRNADFNAVTATVGTGLTAAPTLTPAAGSVLLFTNGSDWSGSDPTPPSGFTQGAARVQTATGIIEGFYKENAPATATGTVTPGGTMDSPGWNSAMLVSIAPGKVFIFDHTGAAQTLTVPAGAQSMSVDLYGAQGGPNSSQVGGKGGRLQATVPVTVGEVLQVNVGGIGTTGPSVAGGFNGGGISGDAGSAGSGGGATDIRRLKQSLFDDFSEADGTNLVGKASDIGGAWAAFSSPGAGPTWRTSSGKAKVNSWTTPGSGSSILVSDTGIPDGNLKTKFSGANADFGVVFRISGTGTGLLWHNSGHLFRIDVVASSFVDIATVGSSYTIGQDLEVRLSGNALTFFIDGVQTGTYSLSGSDITNFGATTRFGFYLGSGNIVTLVDEIVMSMPYTAAQSRVLVAGGGGGNPPNQGVAEIGHGGGLTGASGSNGGGGGGGGGGTQSAGGAGGSAGGAPAAPGDAGTLGVGGRGGRNGSNTGGGGGGGYYGGGAGGSGGSSGVGGGGGGGSSYTDPSAVSVVHTQGARTGHGQAVVTFSPAVAGAGAAPGAITTAARRGSGSIDTNTNEVNAAVSALAGTGNMLVATIVVSDHTGLNTPNTAVLSGVGGVWTKRGSQSTWESSNNHQLITYTCVGYSAGAGTVKATFPASVARHAILVIDEIPNADTYVQGRGFTLGSSNAPSLATAPAAGSVVFGSRWDRSGTNPGTTSGTTDLGVVAIVSSNGDAMRVTTGYKAGSAGGTLNFTGLVAEAATFVGEYANTL